MPKDLNLTWIVRYGYGGALLYLIFVLHDPAEAKTITDASGSVLAPLLLLAAGACIYVFYRHLVGEWFLFPLAHFLDWWGVKGNRHETEGAVSPIFWLRQQGVPLTSCRAAYSAIRQHQAKREARAIFDRDHSEIHILYLTFLALTPAAAIAWSDGAHGVALGCAFAAVVFLIGGLRADVQLHRLEFPTLVPSDPERRAEVLEFLRLHGWFRS